MASRSIAVLFAVLALASASCSRDPHQLKVQYVASGDGYMAQKNYSAAIIEYRNALAQDASFGEARFKLGVAYEASGDLGNALREQVRAADLMRDNVEAQLRAGKLLVAAGQFPEARARALAALAKDPKNVNGLIVLGNALAGLKDIDGAIAQIEEAIEAEPQLNFSYTNLGMLQLGRGNHAAAEAAFKRAIEANPKSIPAHLNMGNLYWASGQRTEAEQEFMTALAIEPNSPDVNRTLAGFYITAGERAKGEPYLKAFAAGGTGVTPKLGLADFYVSDGRVKEATDILAPLSKEDEGFKPATLRLAVIEFRADRRAEAYRLVDEILKRFPKDAQTLVLKAGFLIADRKLDEALTLANAAIESDPGAATAHSVRGQVLQAQGSTDEAIQAFQKMLELAPSAVSAQLRLASLFLARGDTKAAIQYLGQAIKAQPRSAAAHLLMGEAQLQAGNLARAEAELVPLAKANPSDAELQTRLGRLYGAKDDRSRARQAFAAALKLAPGSVAALNGLVALDLVEKNFDGARAKVESRLAVSPDDRSLLFLAGNTYMAIGDLQKAESLFKKFLQLDANNIDAYGRLAGLYLKQGRLEEARTAFEEAARNQTTPVAATTMIGIIYDMQGKRDEARKQYERALTMDPQTPVAANNLAAHYAELGENLDTALQLAQTAKAKLPESAQVSDTLGWIYYRKGLTSPAISQLLEGAQQNPSNPNIHYHLGLAYSKNGDTTEARRSLERALKLNPVFPGAEDARRVLESLKG